MSGKRALRTGRPVRQRAETEALRATAYFTAGRMDVAQKSPDADKAKKWLKDGAQPSETVARLFKSAGISR